MIFEGFSPACFEFLMQIAFHNEKAYFEARRDEFERLVKQPMRALEEGLQPFVLKLDDRLRVGPMAISRIYRDTRFSKDKSPLRDHIWIDYRPPKVRTSEFPSIYTCITPVSYSTGFGMYAPNPTIMQPFREKIIANPAGFLKIIESKKLKKRFALGGEFFAKKRYEHEDPKIEAWLNRKSFHYTIESDDIQRTMRPEYLQEVLDDFKTLSPLYCFVHGLS